MSITAPKHEPDDRWKTAPPLPTDRPPTRREVWAHFHHRFFDLKEHQESPLCDPRCELGPNQELEAFCRDTWVWAYVQRFIHGTWDKQPDWSEGDPVIPEAVATPEEALRLPWARITNYVSTLRSTAEHYKQRRAAA